MSNGRQPVTYFEVDQPLCALRYGETPCSAVLGVSSARKCQNTRKTCPVPQDYSPTDLVTLRFSLAQQGTMRHGVQPIPLLQLTTTPGKINLAGLDDGASAFGEREVVTATLRDGRHSDHLVDPYRLERPFPKSITAGYESNLWHAGTAAPAGYALNQDIAGESTFGKRLGPYGDEEVVNVCKSKDVAAGDPGPDGGWTTSNIIPVNKSASYLFACWFKRLSTATITGASAYWGLHSNGTGDILNLNGTSNSNPYFVPTVVALFMPSADRWYLAVGFVHENGYGAVDTNISGVYDPTTFARVCTGSEYKWTANATLCGHRALHYYNQTISGEAQQMARPQIFQCDAADADDLIRRLCIGEFYDPYTSGTFAGKWAARNPYHQGYACRVRRGYLDQELADMRVQHYVLDRMDGPTGGQFTFVAKDLFSRVEAKKTVAPFPSAGELASDLTGSPGTFTVAPAGIGNLSEEEGGYASITNVTQGYVSIGDELIRVTRAADVFTVLERGAMGTTAEDHDQEDLVQEALVVTPQLPHDIAYTLLSDFTGIPASAINKGAWDVSAAVLVDLFSTIITEPTSVDQLVGELEKQAGFTLWPNVETGMIDLTMLRPAAVFPNVDERSWIIAGSLQPIVRLPDRRVSPVLFYYGQRDPTKPIDDERNFRSRLITSPDEDLYEDLAIHKVFSRWVPTGGRQAAQRSSERILGMFIDPPAETGFTVTNAKLASFGMARYFSLEVKELQDETGAPVPTAFATVSIQRGMNESEISGHSVRFAPDIPEATEEVGTRRVYIENPDLYNLILRSMHDALFPAPTGDEIVEFIVEPGARVGSTSTGMPAVRTGEWPAMVTPPLLRFKAPPTNSVKGRFQGKGGSGGRGTISTGDTGENGGTAFKAEALFSVDGLEGELWGGGAGGGGGGGPNIVGSGGGGGGAGTNPGDGGFGTAQVSRLNGDAGTTDSGGQGGFNDLLPGFSFDGGAGGGPGLDGGAGGGPGGAAGGTKGKYIEGNVFITWISHGDERGGAA